MRPHDEFVELCAVSTTGELSSDEQEKLQQHLASCPACRQALNEFNAVVDVGVPLVLPELSAARGYETISAPSEETAPQSAANAPCESDAHAIGWSGRASRLSRSGPRPEVQWNYIWMSLAAAVVLVAALTIYSYQAGVHRASRAVQMIAAAPVDHGRLQALERQLSDSGHERELLQAKLGERDRLVRDLQRQIRTQSTALAEAATAEASLERTVQGDKTETQRIAEQQGDLKQKLAASQLSLETAQGELNSVERERRQDQTTADSLAAQINDLNAQLRSSEQRIGKQDDLLADDRDIRDLMGARDLYIAEVYDVARDGATRKPYGRIFYTKGKSLVFYAYDLDQQPGVKNASTFQAWGQNGPDRQQAINLGVFYQDSSAKKRWVLKFDDPNKLEQINAVFVTVEPQGGSHKPDGKALLFASLRIDANHP